ncbi:MAG: 1,4-alpha-glucan branching protein GlgB [Ignavibacteriae bacterium]|nr:1,4-alpha-glucan branching protein GlgB [Ignavibacteriota bacterium]
MSKKEFAEYGISDFDLYLLSEGNHYSIYEKLGAKVKIINGKKGVRFAVWAPNAKSVSVVGNFNYWNNDSNPMENVMNSGVWALFIPGLYEGEVYKYAIITNEGSVQLKADPFAFQAELRPKTASVVNSLEGFRWSDFEWMEKRATTDFQKSPYSIYEVHLGSWKKDFNNFDFPTDSGYKSYKQIAYEIVDYAKSMGYTHIELLPIMEHPLDESWGYQVVSYFAPTSRYGSPQDFMFFVDYCHQNGIGVFLDWVPAHFPTDEHGLINFDGTQLFAYKSWKKGFHKDWGTLIFDYGRNEVRNFLISNALFWFEKYHIDGLRVDAVASMLYLDYSREEGEWEPNIYGGRENLEAIDFIKKLNEVTHSYHKGIVTIAEESTAFPMVSRPTYIGGLGFDMKWNMGWMNDTLKYFSKEPIHRKYHQNMITFLLWYAFNENFVLPISHDEVVHGKKSLLEKMPGDDWQRFANLRLFFLYMFGHPGKKLNFMSNDIGQYKEWNVKDSLDWFILDFELHKKLNYFVKDLNSLYKSQPAMFEVDFSPEGFEWVDFSDADSSVIAYTRKSKDNSEILLFVLNMTPVLREGYELGVPFDGYYKELLNSDGLEYGGSGKGNAGGVKSIPKKKNHWFNTINVTLPPLGGIIFKLIR